MRAPTGRRSGALLLSGKYRLESLLAVGGMGSIWIGSHVTLGRSVAVKFIDTGVVGTGPLEAGFLREARLAAAVRHPHVVDVLDFGITDDGEPVMVMELLDGDTLETRMADARRMTTEETVRIMAQVLSALDAVHRAGVLHCDIKPANIMVERSDEPNEPFARLLDFGIAHAIEPLAEASRTGARRAVVGTPEYMAPEQAEGRLDLDERVDVYAVSVLLYELLSGISPFQDEDPERAMFRVMLGSHVPLVSVRPDIPELAAVVERGMAFDRENRPAHARDMRRELLDASGLGHASASTRPPPPSSTHTALHEAPTLILARDRPSHGAEEPRAPETRGPVPRFSRSHARSRC